MNLKKFFGIGVCAYLLFIAIRVAPDKECTLPESGVFPFATQELDLSKEEYRALIQAAVNQMYLKGFRYLGDPRDFDHGHMLYGMESLSKPEIKPPVVAILYHTQEDAFYYHRDNPGSRFDYLDSQARNWVQWVKSKKVENAKNYMLKNGPYDYEHFTISEHALDSKLMGIELSPLYSRQFMFSDLNGKNIPNECRGSKSNLIVVRVPLGEYKTLAILDDKHFWKYYNNYWLKEHK